MEAISKSDEERHSDILVHIGYHKTGSTYLQDHFFKPENGFTTDIGESRTRIVRDLVYPDNFKFDPAGCRAFYEPYIQAATSQDLSFVLSHERLSGYPPSGGYDRMLIAQRLAETFPGSRVLIIIREQKSLIRSLYSQFITDGGDLSLARFLESPEPQLGRMPGFRSEVYEFDLLISYYQGLFGRERVLVLPFEMMVQDIGEFLNRISVFSGKPGPSVIPDVVTNRRRPVTMQRAQKWGNRVFSNNELSRGAWVGIPRFQRRFAMFERFFQLTTPQWLDDRLHSNISRQIKSFAGTRYAGSNLRTGALIGVDLAKYGYDVGASPGLRNGDSAP
jgi:hypothetical protein